MDKKIPFEKVAGKIGFATAFVMFADRLSQETMDKFTFDNWADIHQRVSLVPSGKDQKKMGSIIAKRMLEKADGIADLLYVYQIAEVGSQEEKAALEKLDQFQYPEKWIEIFEKEGRLYVGSKVLSYVKEKIEKFVDLA